MKVSTGSWQITGLLVTFTLALQVHARLRMQPIGIDLGPELVTAAYAYDTNNVTIISTVRPELDDSYRETMLRLRLLHSQEHPSPFAKKKRQLATSGTLKAAKSAVQSVVSVVEPYLPYLHDVGLPPWLGGALSIAFNTVSAALGAADGHLVGPIPPEDIKNEFVKVLREVRDHARTEHNIRIRSATFTGPGFFNSTLNDLIVEAAEELGIWTSPIVLPRSIAVTYANDDDHRGGKGLRYLIIDQGEYHCDLRTVYTGKKDDENAIKGVLLPLEPFASANINRRLAQRLIDESKEMQTQIAWGASKGDLWQPIKKARFLIRDDIYAEVMGEEKPEEEHHDEYPLDLMGWGDGSVQAVLKWKDIQEEEETFVDSLSANIMSVMVALRGWRNKESSETLDESQTPEEVDRVIILTSHYDGRLIKRAVQSVFGESVEVVGGTIRGFQLAATGASQVALMTHNAWEKPGSCKKHDEL
ncbi:uncharacterized protein KD926_011244 [Aspergillus affinis]|uniref:uncharacterized protein n=1 Tax=Aspergillus affinis TaxID=1070780 RepID=UPI0022FE8B79|nr:uncharacterized protein KD926_011244 [Aspergillus affinis]KAI9038110.1 hypothetical protein KD926_011244 [Aspergillus affinis]